MRSRTAIAGSVLLLAAAAMAAGVAILGGSTSTVLLAAPAVRAEALLPELERCIGSPAGRFDKASGFDIETRADAARCAEPLVAQATVEGGVLYGYQVMTGLMGLDPRFDDCHPAAHGIGHAATQVVKDDMRLLEDAFIDCTYGYVDGVVMALAERYESWPDSRLADLVSRLCQTYPFEGEQQALAVGNCFHGYGHVLSERHQPMIVDAFAACSLIPDGSLPGFDSPPAQCAGGVAMDFATAGLTGRKVVPEMEHPQEVCLLVGENMRRACLNFSAHDDIESRGGPAPYIAWCVDEPGMREFLASCAASAGTWGGRTRQVPDAVEACDVLSGRSDGPALVAACLNSVVVSLHESTNTPVAEAVKEFCAAADRKLCARLDAAVLTNSLDGSGPSGTTVSGVAGGTASEL